MIQRLSNLSLRREMRAAFTWMAEASESEVTIRTFPFMTPRLTGRPTAQHQVQKLHYLDIYRNANYMYYNMCRKSYNYKI